VIPISSSINGVDYEIYLQGSSLAGDRSARPLVFTLDADYQFPIVASHVRHLAERGQAPDAVVASIAYAGPRNHEHYRFNRSRDDTPVRGTSGYGAAADAATGGGEAFSKVIANELLPAIAAECGPLSDLRLFIGHSFGGLFGAWICGERPELFNRFVLVSPSLWFGDRYVPKRAADPKRYRPDSAMRMFIGVGALEEQPQNGRPMVSDAEAFASTLREIAGARAEVECRVFAGETHASIFPAAFSAGLRAVL
jgi:hypothetical protein